MLFVARYNNGDCAIAEADDEATVQELLTSEEAGFDPATDKIVSLRPLHGTFISRWCFERKDSTELELDRLCGTLEGPVVDEILEQEYPAIMKAHESLFDQFASLANPPMSIPAKIRQAEGELIDEWSKDLRRRVRQAIDFELQRYK